MSVQMVGLFETPIVVDDLPNAVAVNAALKPLILARRAERPGVKISNIGGWQSEHDVADWAGQPLADILRHVTALADAHCVDIVSPGAPRHRWVSDIWVNVSPPAGIESDAHPSWRLLVGGLLC